MKFETLNLAESYFRSYTIIFKIVGLFKILYCNRLQSIKI
ncbi:hypothetical protein D1BOALGB6SA_2563 [Olavius sp. associated proteobacterium Delta 1]|nr:hypothetical protein D1BOALGB6SA_2563 [Olavius sp. associated proteobacterium Delta 1]